MLGQNEKAPDFSLQSSDFNPVSLSDFKGRKNVVLLFYPADWSPVCGDEIAVFSAMKSIFDKEDTILLGISVDSMFCHKAYTDAHQVKFPLLADFHPNGAVAQSYGVFDEQTGYCKRALFLVDKQGLSNWSYLSPDEINPGADGVLEAIGKLNKSNS